MAFRLDIEYESQIERDDSSQLTASVIDTDTDMEVTVGVTYLWTLAGTGTLSSTTAKVITYNADGFGVDDVPASISITCTATITGIQPEVGTITLMTLADLGVDNVVVNMLIEANLEGDYLYNGDTDSVEAGSDTNISATLTIHQVLWRLNASNEYELVLNRDPLDTGTMADYWVANGNLSQKSVYIIAPDGRYVEFDDSLTSNSQVTDDSITYTIPAGDVDAALRDPINDISDGQRFILGIGDTNSVDTVSATARNTVSLTILGDLDVSASVFDRSFIRPIIDKITETFINRIIGNTGFNKLEDVDNKPRAAYGVVDFNIPHYDTTENEQRHRPVIQTINIADRLNGVDEFSETDYVVMLTQVDDKVVGVQGRTFAAFSVHGKTETSFKICYEEGVASEAFGSTTIRLPSVRIAWFARGR